MSEWKVPKKYIRRGLEVLASSPVKLSSRTNVSRNFLHERYPVKLYRWKIFQWIENCTIQRGNDGSIVCILGTFQVRHRQIVQGKFSRLMRTNSFASSDKRFFLPTMFLSWKKIKCEKNEINWGMKVSKLQLSGCSVRD